MLVPTGQNTFESMTFDNLPWAKPQPIAYNNASCQDAVIPTEPMVCSDGKKVTVNVKEDHDYYFKNECSALTLS